MVLALPICPVKFCLPLLLSSQTFDEHTCDSSDPCFLSQHRKFYCPQEKENVNQLPCDAYLCSPVKFAN